MRAIVLNQPDLSAGVAEGNQLLPQQPHALGAPVRLHLPAEQERDPVQAEQLTHGRAGPHTRDQLVVLRTQHALLPPPARVRTSRVGTWLCNSISRCSRPDSSMARHTSMVAFAHWPSCTTGWPIITAE